MRFFYRFTIVENTNIEQLSLDLSIVLKEFCNSFDAVSNLFTIK